MQVIFTNKKLHGVGNGECVGGVTEDKETLFKTEYRGLKKEANVKSTKVILESTAIRCDVLL